MTDKQIMIDKVDVSECFWLWVNTDKNYKSRCIMNKDVYSQCTYCKDYPNCLFKQLARKTQECEELKEKYKWYDHYKDSALLNKKLCDKASDERARYRKALEEIEEFIEEEDWSILDYVFKRIKDIISKAKGEGE